MRIRSTSTTRNGVPEPSTETRTAWLEKSRPGKRVSVKVPAPGSGGVGRRGENGDGRATMRPGARDPSVRAQPEDGGDHAPARTMAGVEQYLGRDGH